MRGDVLEVMAEEIAGRPVDPLASFTSWDDGRRKLNGMAKGRRWDIDRDQHAFETDTHREIRRLLKLRARHRRPDLYRESRRRYEAIPANKARRTQLRKARYEKNRARMLAVLKASRLKHKAKRNAESLAYYHAHRERCIANNRAYYRAHRAELLARLYAKRPRVGKRKCTMCRQPGHNRRRCGRA